MDSNAERTSEITDTLASCAAEDPQAVQQLMALVYDDFRALARSYLDREPPGHTLQPTALVNEAFLRLVDQKRVDWKGKTHFFAVGATIMRRILVDHARAKLREKRGGGRQRVMLQDDLQISNRNEEDVLGVDDAIERLAKRDERQAKIVELRFFGGLTVSEVAEVLGVSKRTVESEWTMIRAWLRRDLEEQVQA